ncbi:hypothetical protein E3N88_21947 [Mikania micrantha]|uniref:AAA+ ATPase domain-containing protein n=1 Tax=Mikania micrantha TaxID=192012 RepID=A0A5N6N904_9ASTR|nr:hypothetical protein E3N88_21947 [Mikania micrantha]
MTKWCLLLPIVLAVVAQTIAARDISSTTNNHVVGLTDQKNLFTLAGLGGFAGLDNNGQPIGGGGLGAGIGIDIGNTNAAAGVGAAYGYGGSGTTAGGIGGFASLGNGFGGLPAVGGGGIGAGDDGGAKDRTLKTSTLSQFHLEHYQSIMGQGTPGGLNRQNNLGDRKDGDKKEKKFEPAAPPARVGRKQRKQKGPEAAARLPTVTPHSKCRLRLLKLERIKDYLLMEEEFVANQERLKPQEEKTEEDRSKVDDLRGSPMSVGNLEELIDENHAIVSSSIGPEYYVGILSFVDKDQLEPGCAILMHNKVLSVVGLLQDDVDPMVSVMKVEKAPLESYADIDIGIKPPKGVILYGEPGTGKTLLAKAVANSTSATFLRVVGSELIQKYLGDGPKLVRELFRVADDLSPSIVFIDEIDAVGTKRYDAHSGGEREIQRTMLELLNQLDGFDSRGDVKVILATNKIESLDPALLRPGRIDRKIEFPLPDIKTRRRIFQIHTSRMTLADDVNLEEFVMTKDEFSGADIKAICTEAGLLALRERRMKVTHADFKKAKDKVMFKKKEGVPEGLYM